MMKTRFNYKIFIPVLCSTVFIIAVLSFLIDAAEVIEQFNFLRINNHQRFNSFLQKVSILAFIFLLLITFYNTIKHKLKSIRFNDYVQEMLRKILFTFNLKTLLIITLIYLLILFVLAIKNYDLGVDEVTYIIYAKSFYSYGFAFCTANGNMVWIDNYAMLPIYIGSTILFLFNASAVWHFKLFATIISLVSVSVIFSITKKLYDLDTSILFLFLVVIQPGFGFVSSSFFGEISQATFIFLAAYCWLNKKGEVTRKTAILTSMFFTLALQTKFQSLFSVVFSLLFFRFIVRDRKVLQILFYTLLFTFLLAIVRLIPALIYDPTSIIKVLRSWFLLTQSQDKRDILQIVDKITVFNKFIPLLFCALVIFFASYVLSNPFEKFLRIYTTVFFLWWIFFSPHIPYRGLFMALIPLLFLSSVILVKLFKGYFEKYGKNKVYPISLPVLAFLLLSFWGFYTNLKYAYIGYNDGVEFDLDGYKPSIYSQIVTDNTQKEFFEEVNSRLSPNDSLFIAASGQPMFVSQFYLGSNRVFDFNALKSIFATSSTPKLVIDDRTAYPLGLSEGYRRLDSLYAERKLLIKKGEHELYLISKK